MVFTIPEEYKPGFEFLLSLDDDNIDVVVSSLLDFSPTVEKLEYEIAERLLKANNIDRDIALSIGDIIVSLRQLKKQEKLSNAEIVYLISTSIERDEKFLFTAEQIEQFRIRLSGLLKILEDKALALHLDTSEKAFNLSIEHERIFSGSRIVTDVRPVFDSESETKIETTIIVHTLRIRYKDADGTKEFYVGLDSEDLDSLREQITIAISNSTTLQSTLNKAKIGFISSTIRANASKI